MVNGGAMVDEFYNQNSIYKKLGDQAKAKEAAGLLRLVVEAIGRLKSHDR